MGLIAIGLGLLAQSQNVAFLVALAFALAASSNLPVSLLTLCWRRFNATRASWGFMGGSLTCPAPIAGSPNIMGADPPEKTTERRPVQAQALFRLENPGIISMPAGFASAALGTLIGVCRQDEEDQTFEEMPFRAPTGADVGGTVAAHD